MTDPKTQGQQQGGQQPYTDDILGSEDIFATIPEVEEDDIPYGDMLEKKYQSDPQPQAAAPVVEKTQQVAAPAVVEKPVAQEKPAPVVQEPTPVVQEPTPVVQEPTPEQIIEPVAEEEIQNINQQVGIEETKVDTLLDTKLQTDVQKKFGELFFTTKRIYDIKTKLGTPAEYFDILGADNDKVFILYRFLLDETTDPTLVITKVEQDKTTEEETTNELRFMFNQEESSLEVMVNDTLLFDEIQDFTEDQKKKMQVSEKLNKFIFLASEEQRKMEKEIQAKEEAEREKRKLQDIFRNF